MKKIIAAILMLSFAFLTAQNVFVWDKDDEYTIMNPEDPWFFVGIEFSIINALEENEITPTVGVELPSDLSEYDMIFATVGIWCDG